MYRNHSVGVIMPGRNVAHILEKQLSFIPECVDEIILVSNCSKDDTVQIGIQLQSKYPKLKIIQDNRCDAHKIGYGYAIQTGFKNSTTDLVFKIDADCTYPVEVLESVLDFMLDQKADLISCNRHPTSGPNKISWFLNLGVSILNIETFILFGHRIQDIITGMYGGKRGVINSLKLNEGGWNFSIEIKLKAFLKKNIVFKEFHIIQHPPQTPTHQKYFQTGFNHMLYIFRTRLESAKNRL